MAHREGFSQAEFDKTMARARQLKVVAAAGVESIESDTDVEDYGVRVSHGGGDEEDWNALLEMEKAEMERMVRAESGTPEMRFPSFPIQGGIYLIFIFS